MILKIPKIINCTFDTSAAHCVFHEGKVVSPAIIEVYVGNSNENNYDQTMKVQNS